MTCNCVLFTLTVLWYTARRNQPGGHVILLFYVIFLKRREIQLLSWEFFCSSELSCMVDPVVQAGGSSPLISQQSTILFWRELVSIKQWLTKKARPTQMTEDLWRRRAISSISIPFSPHLLLCMDAASRICFHLPSNVDFWNGFWCLINYFDKHVLSMLHVNDTHTHIWMIIQ